MTNAERRKRLHANILHRFPGDPYFEKAAEIDNKYPDANEIDASHKMRDMLLLCVEQYIRDTNGGRLVLIDGAGI